MILAPRDAPSHRSPVRPQRRHEISGPELSGAERRGSVDLTRIDGAAQECGACRPRSEAVVRVRLQARAGASTSRRRSLTRAARRRLVQVIYVRRAAPSYLRPRLHDALRSFAGRERRRSARGKRSVRGTSRTHGCRHQITNECRLRSLRSLRWNMALWRVGSVWRTGLFNVPRLVGPSLEWATSAL
jgi:hypothetical protein